MNTSGRRTVSVGHGADREPAIMHQPTHRVFILYKSALFCDLATKLLSDSSEIRVAGMTNCVEECMEGLAKSGSRTVVIEGSVKSPADAARLTYLATALNDSEDLHLLMLDLGGHRISSRYTRRSEELTGERLRALVLEQ